MQRWAHIILYLNLCISPTPITHCLHFAMTIDNRTALSCCILEFWLPLSPPKNKQNKTSAIFQPKLSNVLLFSNKQEAISNKQQPPRCHHFFFSPLPFNGFTLLPFFNFQFFFLFLFLSLVLVLLLNAPLCLVGCAVEVVDPKLHWSLHLSLLPLSPQFHAVSHFRFPLL